MGRLYLVRESECLTPVIKEINRSMDHQKVLYQCYCISLQCFIENTLELRIAAAR